MNGVKVNHDLVGNDMLLLFDLAEKQLSQSRKWMDLGGNKFAVATITFICLSQTA